MSVAIKTLLRRFAKDEDATMTVEFVIIFPVLFTWWIGSIVFFDAFDARAGAARVSHTIADIMSRQTDTSNAFIDDLLVLQNRMLPKEPTGAIRVSDIVKNVDGTLAVAWSYSTANLPLTVADIPMASIPGMNAGQHILLIDTYVPYIPIADWVGVVSQTWTNRVFTNARFVANIPNTNFP